MIESDIFPTEYLNKSTDRIPICNLQGCHLIEKILFIYLINYWRKFEIILYYNQTFKRVDMF